MPNYTVTSGTTTLQAGQEYAAQYIDMIIAPAAGYTITPENFVIGEATYDFSGSANTWVGGNVSPIVEKVEFLQDVLNVKARVYIDSAVFSADSSILVDIDESPTNPIVNDVYGVCLDVEYPHDTSNNATVTFIGLVDGATTITTDAAGSASTPTAKNVKRLENDMSSQLIFTFTVVPDTGYSFMEAPGVYVDVDPSVANDLTYGSVLNSSGNGVVTVYYTSTPTSQSLTPCDLQNKIHINYTAVADVVTSTNTVHGVFAATHLDMKKQFTPVKVTGDPGTEYTIKLKDTTNSKYYNWTTGAFVAGVQSKTVTLDHTGSKSHLVEFSATTSTRSVSILIGASGSPVSTLATGVPTADGDKTITQYGFNLIKLELHTDNADYYGTLPTHANIRMPARFPKDGYIKPKASSITLSGTTDGSSKIFRPNGKIPTSLIPGMIVTGSDIAHDTTVVSIEDSYITLSAAVNISTSKPLVFRSKNMELVGFSFTIPPSTTTTVPNYTAIAPNASFKNPSKAVYGLKTKSGTTDTSVPGTALILDDTSGFVKGQDVSGDFIPAGAYIASINHATKTLTLSDVHTSCVGGVIITIKNANNPSVEVIDMKVEQSGVNVVIRGYLKVPEVAFSSSFISINIDDLITAS